MCIDFDALGFVKGNLRMRFIPSKQNDRTIEANVDQGQCMLPVCTTVMYLFQIHPADITGSATNRSSSCRKWFESRTDEIVSGCNLPRCNPRYFSKKRRRGSLTYRMGSERWYITSMNLKAKLMLHDAPYFRAFTRERMRYEIPGSHLTRHSLEKLTSANYYICS